MRIATTILAFLAFCASAQAAEYRLHWQVVQPFRFLRFESDHKIHEWALAEILRQSSGKAVHVVSGMEAKLNDPGWWKNTPPGGTKTYKELFAELRRAELAFGRREIPFDPRFGWASMLRNDVSSPIASGTCWRSDHKDYSGCLSDVGQIRGGDQYAFPTAHLVELRAEMLENGVWKPFDGACKLRIATEVGTGFGFLDSPTARNREQREIDRAKCSDKAYLRVEYGKTYEIELASGADAAREAVAVRDLLIAGIGDSFASGEGNPELPAKLDAAKGIRPYVAEADDTNTTADDDVQIPVRLLQKNQSKNAIAQNSQARWLDPQCHRSVYGPQYRAALAVALAGQRHHAVTFISYACSGAEITDGFFWPQDHRECNAAGSAGERMHQPQISGLVRTLSRSNRLAAFRGELAADDRFFKTNEYLRGDKCESWPGKKAYLRNPVLVIGKLQRRIDLLMVGVGGNDIGFSPLVTRIVINSGLLNVNLGIVTNFAVRAFYREVAGAISLAEVDKRLGYLDERYGMLAKAISQKLEIDEPKRVLVAGYPGFARNEKGRFCPGGNKGMNVSKLFSVHRDKSGTGKVRPEDGDEKRLMLNAAIRKIADKKGWTYVSTLDANGADAFELHGYCAVSTNSAFKTAEILDLPHGENTWQKFGSEDYNPATNFHPYVSRQRWVRTFNDAFMLAYYFKWDSKPIPTKQEENAAYMAQRSLGGPMHLTAEGYAHVADRLYEAAAKVLFDPTTGLLLP